ncbi:hypothetical protein HHI36_016363 [Cryptolaemus montrouzieri]|uniref:Uncharacterized protein n=1 Tax=Cryptolaemus montrouzieri TaxID=559131 RepID=A0ABD2NJH3_9CUCU
MKERWESFEEAKRKGPGILNSERGKNRTTVNVENKGEVKEILGKGRCRILKDKWSHWRITLIKSKRGRKVKGSHQKKTVFLKNKLRYLVGGTNENYRDGY